MFTVCSSTASYIYKQMFLQRTIKKDGRSPPHLAPYDIFVTTKTFRHYWEKSKDGKPGVLHIKTTKENVYYHPQLAWLEKQHAELAENRTIPDQVKFR